MRASIVASFLVLSASIALEATPARAQLLDQLKGAVGGGSRSAGSGLAGSLGGLGMPSVASAGSGNIAGVLQYCMRNNYLGGAGAESTESGLLGKLGSRATASTPFAAGNRGVLQTGNGKSFNLGGAGGQGGGGLKAQLTQKLCDQVLRRAKSLI